MAQGGFAQAMVSEQDGKVGRLEAAAFATGNSRQFTSVRSTPRHAVEGVGQRACPA